jgi:chromate reductase
MATGTRQRWRERQRRPLRQRLGLRLRYRLERQPPLRHRSAVLVGGALRWVRYVRAGAFSDVVPGAHSTPWRYRLAWTMATILGISGSLRRGSYNAALLRAAVDLAPPTLAIQVASIREVPLYDGDFEAEHGVPEPVRGLKDRLAAADGLLLVTPEYNSSIPGVVKNAIDWMSRPAKDIPRVFGGKPVALMGATPSHGGTILSQAAWLPVLRTLGTLLWSGPRVYVSDARNVFDAEGRLVDDAVRANVANFLAGFATFIARVRAPSR